MHGQYAPFLTTVSAAPSVETSGNRKTTLGSGCGSRAPVLQRTVNPEARQALKARQALQALILRVQARLQSPQDCLYFVRLVHYVSFEPFPVSLCAAFCAAHVCSAPAVPGRLCQGKGDLQSSVGQSRQLQGALLGTAPFPVFLQECLSVLVWICIPCKLVCTHRKSKTCTCT